MIHPCEIPEKGFINRYKEQGDYTDCFTTEVDGKYSCEQFVQAFYTSWLFKLERLIISLLVLKPSSDTQVKQLVNREISTFSAWRVEYQDDSQWFMCDYQNKTRSWFMVNTYQVGESCKTQLYFGTAIVKTAKDKYGNRMLSLFFKGLMGFHKIYSRGLLSTAKSRLKKA